MIMRTIFLMTVSILLAQSASSFQRGMIFQRNTLSKGRLFGSINKVVVFRNRQSMEFRNGSPLVFEGSIAYTVGPKKPTMAELVQVHVENDKPTQRRKKGGGYKHHTVTPEGTSVTNLLGWGVYNPLSLYRVRFLCHANLLPNLARKIQSNDEQAIGTIIRSKLRSALETRLALMLPSHNTDTYRLVNGEGDGLSGLAVDILGGEVAVIMSSAAWCEVYRDEILKALDEVLCGKYDIIWKTTQSRLRQDGFETQKTPLVEPENRERAVMIQESGIKYTTSPFEDGQKTGVYCDQRENKYHLAQLCKDKRMLDLCCYHGGFSLNAKVIGGALHCTGVDSSQDAIEICKKNAKLNNLGDDSFEFVSADIANFMKEKMGNTTWDVIVLDPPKLAPSVSGLERASRKYHSLNRDALKLIDSKGGLFLTCTCSAAMTQKDGGQYFQSVVQQAAASAGRHITLLKVSGAASCHTLSPSSYPAGAYLTAALFHVAPLE